MTRSNFDEGGNVIPETAPWFNIENFSSSVLDRDNSSNEGVITGEATFNWSGMLCGDNAVESVTPEGYEIEYFISVKPLSESDIAKQSFTGTIPASAIKGTSAVYDFSTNEEYGYVYWRIRGVNTVKAAVTDENNNVIKPAVIEKSDWVMGENFYSGIRRDVTAPDFTNSLMSIIVDPENNGVVKPDDSDGIDVHCPFP